MNENTSCWEFWENFESIWWKLNRKIEFLIFLGKLLLKIEPSEITSFFYNNFFHFGGVGTFPMPPPWRRLCFPFRDFPMNLIPTFKYINSYYNRNQFQIFYWPICYCYLTCRAGECTRREAEKRGTTCSTKGWRGRRTESGESGSRGPIAHRSAKSGPSRANGRQTALSATDAKRVRAQTSGRPASGAQEEAIHSAVQRRFECFVHPTCVHWRQMGMQVSEISTFIILLSLLIYLFYSFMDMKSNRKIIYSMEIDLLIFFPAYLSDFLIAIISSSAFLKWFLNSNFSNTLWFAISIFIW